MVNPGSFDPFGSSRAAEDLARAKIMAGQGESYAKSKVNAIMPSYKDEKERRKERLADVIILEGSNALMREFDAEIAAKIKEIEELNKDMAANATAMKVFSGHSDEIRSQLGQMGYKLITYKDLNPNSDAQSDSVIFKDSKGYYRTGLGGERINLTPEETAQLKAMQAADKNALTGDHEIVRGISKTVNQNMKNVAMIGASNSGLETRANDLNTDCSLLSATQQNLQARIENGTATAADRQTAHAQLVQSAAKSGRTIPPLEMGDERLHQTFGRALNHTGEPLDTRAESTTDSETAQEAGDLTLDPDPRLLVLDAHMNDIAALLRQHGGITLENLKLQLTDWGVPPSALYMRHIENALDPQTAKILENMQKTAQPGGYALTAGTYPAPTL